MMNIQRKEKRFRKKLAKKPHKIGKILKKYSRREKRRVEDYLHKISSIIVSEAVKYNAKIVMEDLKYIRNSVNKKEQGYKEKTK